MNTVQYILVDRTVKMTPGKLASQVAHAAVKGAAASELAWRGRSDPAESLYANWCAGGHAKVVLECDNLLVADRYIRDRGFETFLIIDEGRTEFKADLTPTTLGTLVLDKENRMVKDTFGQFKLYGSTSNAKNLDARLAAAQELIKVYETEFNKLHRGT